MTKLLDLFCGCGGLSLGAKAAGAETELAIDVDPILTSSFKVNFPKAQFLLQDIAKLDQSALSRLVPNGVDGIIGGPPCQAFSEMGRRDKNDPRRDLISAYFKVVSNVKPAFFVMENVPGLGFAENKNILDEGLGKLEGRWSLVGPFILDAADYGAPTARRRLFVIGYDPERVDFLTADHFAPHRKSKTTVRDAIADLGGARQLADNEAGFDRWRYSERESLSSYAKKMRSTTGIFSGHRRTTHSIKVIKRFSTVPRGTSDPVGKHYRLDWDGLCPVLRAGTGSDRGSYQSVRPLHPTQDRVITAREAARLQGFPDRFLFHPTVWHSFRMIGNSVSPIIAEAIIRTVIKHSQMGLSKLAAE